MDPPTAKATAGVPTTSFYKSKDGLESHGQHLCVDDYSLFLDALFRSSNFQDVGDDELSNEDSEFHVSERHLGSNLVVYVKNRRSDTTLFIPGYSKFAQITPLYHEIMATISPLFRDQDYEIAGVWTRKIVQTRLDSEYLKLELDSIVVESSRDRVELSRDRVESSRAWLDYIN